MNVSLPADLIKELTKRARHLGVKPESLAEAYLRVRLRRPDTPVSDNGSKAMIRGGEPPDDWWED